MSRDAESMSARSALAESECRNFYDRYEGRIRDHLSELREGSFPGEGQRSFGNATRYELVQSSRSADREIRWTRLPILRSAMVQ